ncbi:MAG: DegT/DnrJ/EryC1/StrS family aminotransferase [Bacteroidota bacterium]
MSNRPIELSPPYFESDLSPEILNGDPAEIISGFEQEISKYVGRKYGVAVNSGTAAIHLALKVLGIGKGDIVLCQSMTYAATAFPILYEGAQPVFIDSEPNSWNMDSKLLKQAIQELIANGQKPAAIMVVDLYGMPVEMKEILAIAKEYDIPVIEDAAEALGAAYYDKGCGGFGTLSILSFNSNKVITSGGGGMLLTDDEELKDKALYYASQAKDPGSVMNHREIGYNYRMNHVNAAMGHQQFGELEKRLRRRREVYKFYKEQLGGLPGVKFVEEPSGSCSSRWLSTLLIDPIQSGGISRIHVGEALEAYHIESRPLWKPMHLQPVFKDAKAYVNGVSEKLFDQGLCLPSGSNLTDTDLEQIVKVVRRTLSK